MDDLIIRSLMAATTAEEERQLMRWRSAAAENDARYRSLQATWELAGHAWSPPATEPPAVEEILERARRMDGARREARRPAPRRRRFRVMAGAAALAASVAAALLAVQLMRPAPAGTAPEPYTVVAAERQTLHLPDGSAVHLEAGSTLGVDPAEPRVVTLSGRAYFGIHHDPENPFLVRSTAGETRVLGTRFDLTVGDDELTVVVVEGRVEVVSDSGQVEVGPGEQSRVVSGGPPTKARADVRAVTDWLGDVFIFQATSLSAVALELEQRFDKRIIIEDSALAERTVTAVFADRSLEQILPALCRAVDAECVTEPEAVRFTP